MMSNFLRKVGRFTGAIVDAGSTLVHYKFNNIPFRILGKAYFTPNPVPSSASGVVLDDLPKARAPFGRDTIANAVAKVGPAVVQIDVPRYCFGIFPVVPRICSGMIIDKDGTILTCVLERWGILDDICLSSRKVKVTLQDGRTFRGKMVNADKQSDIAIVKINSETPLTEAKLGASSRLRPGDWVIAVGSPFRLQHTVTAGIVSCVNRKGRDLGMSGMPREYLQADCAISWGNHGGPLVNMDGEVVGINIIKEKGFSCSVPIDSVDKVIEHLKKSG